MASRIQVSCLWITGVTFSRSSSKSSFIHPQKHSEATRVFCCQFYHQSVMSPMLLSSTYPWTDPSPLTSSMSSYSLNCTCYHDYAQYNNNFIFFHVLLLLFILKRWREMLETCGQDIAV